MKKLLLVAGIIATAFVSECQTAPMAETTLRPMPNVGPLTFIKRTTVVTPMTTNITMVETIQSPTAAQKELQLEELRVNRDVEVARAANRWVVNPPAPPSVRRQVIIYRPVVVTPQQPMIIYRAPMVQAPLCCGQGMVIVDPWAGLPVARYDGPSR